MSNANYVIREAYGSLVGKTIRAISVLSEEEVDNLGWADTIGFDIPFAFEFTDGTLVVPTSDNEGNGPGALIVQAP